MILECCLHVSFHQVLRPEGCGVTRPGGVPGCLSLLAAVIEYHGLAVKHPSFIFLQLFRDMIF